MSISDRKERQNEELRALIIQKSWTIINEEGWQALSIRKIADAIEYSVPVIYKHFQNKEAILAHFSKVGFSTLADLMQKSLKDISVPTKKISALADTYWSFASTHSHYYRIMFGLGIPPCDAINSSVEMKKTSELMYNAIRDTLEEATNNIADKHLKMKTFWSTLHGFVAIELLSNNQIQNKPSPLVRDAVEGFIFSLINNK